MVDPAGWAVLEADLVAVVIGMPLAKLQRFGEGHTTVEGRFIYDFSWREEAGQATVSRPGFDDRLHLLPGVGVWLVRLAPLIRPLVQAKWAARVAARNQDAAVEQRRRRVSRASRNESRPRKYGIGRWIEDVG